MIADRKLIQKQLSILGMSRTWEIIDCLRNKPMIMKDIATKTGIPYTTVQKRIADLKDAKLVKSNGSTSSRYTYGKKIKLIPFRIKLDASIISETMNTEDLYPHAG